MGYDLHPLLSYNLLLGSGSCTSGISAPWVPVKYVASQVPPYTAESESAALQDP